MPSTSFRGIKDPFQGRDPPERKGWQGTMWEKSEPDLGRLETRKGHHQYVSCSYPPCHCVAHSLSSFLSPYPALCLIGCFHGDDCPTSQRSLGEVRTQLVAITTHLYIWTLYLLTNPSFIKHVKIIHTQLTSQWGCELGMVF